MSSTEITPFAYEGQQVRTVVIDGAPWFVLADLARVLDIKEVSRLASRLDDALRQTHPIADSLGRTQQATIVNEPGMYEVVIRSDKPEAATFRKWITNDVLPAIRKTGHYGAPVLTGPELMARALVEAAETIRAAEDEVKALAPKAEAFDAFLSTAGDYSLNEAAKVLARDGEISIGEHRLRDKLQAWRWLYRSAVGKPRAMQTQVDCGRLVEKAQWHYHPQTGEKVLDAPQVRITAKGLEAIRRRLLNEVAGLAVTA